MGEIRLTFQYSECTVLPDSSYDDLFHALLKEKMTLTKMVSQCSAKKEKFVADCLVKAFEMRKTGVHYVKEITASEIRDTPDPNIIFRGNTVGTKSVDIYMRLVGLPYLHKVLKPIVTEIYQGKKSCEVDQVRLSPGDKGKKEQKKNLASLLAYVKQIFEAIRTSFLWCPASFRNIFEHIQLTVCEQFPGNDVIRYTGPSGFIFLRFFCPALLNPKLFALMPDHPPTGVARDLTLIAKTLQNLANLVPFGKKEPYMEGVNNFIEENMTLMREFIDKLCSAPTEPIDEIPSKATVNFGREMSRIHGHMNVTLPLLKEKFGPENKTIVHLEGILKKLDTEQEALFSTTTSPSSTPSTPTTSPSPILLDSNPNVNNNGLTNSNSGNYTPQQ